MRPTTLIVLCGLPYAGKTRLAAQLARRLEADIVSIDEVLKDCGYSWDRPEEFTESAWTTIFDEVNQRLIARLAGNGVVYDSTNHDRPSRDRLRNLANSRGAGVVLIMVAASTALVRDRHAQSRTTANRAVIPDGAFERTLDDYEPPTRDEGALVFNQHDDLDEWLVSHAALLARG